MGTEGKDTITGTEGPDVIVGLGGDDVIRGGGGDDVLCGDAGADQLLGGLGDDHLDPGTPAPRRPDQLRWSASRVGVTIRLGDGTSGTSTGEGHDTFLLGPDVVVVGSARPDTVYGSPLSDQIRTLGGGDVVYAASGDDRVVVEANRKDTRSVDVVRGGAGDDRVTSFAGRDRVDLGQGRDGFSGYGIQPVEVYGRRGDDSIFAQVGARRAATLNGGPGTDYLTLVATFSGPALRTMLVRAQPGRVQLAGRPGTRGVVAGFEDFGLLGRARWDFRGTPGPDRVTTAGYESVLVARTLGGDDTMEGGERDDVLIGGRGRDTAWGHGGRDVCRAVEVRHSCERR